MTFEEAMKNPNQGYILIQKELLYQAYIDYYTTKTECKCDESTMICDACDMCFNGEPLNIQTWLLVLGILVNGEQIKNIWLTGELLFAS